MGKIVFVVGKSGSGKSTSIRNLDPDSTYIINVCNKDLPFKGSSKHYKLKSDTNKGNLFVTNEYAKIIKVVQGISDTRADIKTLIIDDFNYILTHQVFQTAMQKGYDKFVIIAKSVNDILECIQQSRNDLYVFIMWHTELDADGSSKIKTVGKMIDNQLTPEGMATIVLHTKVRDNKYKFLTQYDGSHIAKSPMGMFADQLIDNDLQYVIKNIHEYYSNELQDVQQ